MPITPVLVALVLAVTATGAAAQETPGAALVGAWTLNFEQSSTPPDVDPSALEDDMPPPPRAGLGGLGSPGGRVGPGRGGDSGGTMRMSSRERQRMRTLLRRMGDAPPTLTIVMDGARVLLTDGLGRTTALGTANRRQRIETADGDVAVRARWDGHELRVEEDFGSRMKLHYVYAVAGRDAARQLIVTVTMEGAPSRRDSRGPAPVRRVYDPQPGGAPGAP